MKSTTFSNTTNINRKVYNINLKSLILHYNNVTEEGEVYFIFEESNNGTRRLSGSSIELYKS